MSTQGQSPNALTEPGPDAPLLPVDQERDLVAALTRGVLADALPEELGVFDAAPDHFLDGHGAEPAARDEVLGFGVETVALLTPYVVAAATAAVRFLAGLLLDAAKDQTKPVLGAWLRRLVRRDAASAPEAVDTSPPALTPDTIARVHEVTHAVCLQLGLKPDDAALVSDAVTGRLVASPV